MALLKIICSSGYTTPERCDGAEAVFDTVFKTVFNASLHLHRCLRQTGSAVAGGQRTGASKIGLLKPENLFPPPSPYPPSSMPRELR
jgi:hypothetical protein